jgi:hypothetical protein
MFGGRHRSSDRIADRPIGPRPVRSDQRLRGRAALPRLRDPACERLSDCGRLDARKPRHQHRVRPAQVETLGLEAREPRMRTINEPRQIRRINAFRTQTFAYDFPLLRLSHQ